ncbi:MAG: peptidase T [Candidatus Competibacteraceae bacterium]|nr:peptidase T [Candidatus Competibacteraceae bacterium]
MNIDFSQYDFTVADRFIRYVQINTQSNPDSDTFPSTSCQLDFARSMAEELRIMGMQDVVMDDNGYVYATLPANSEKKVPVICFCSHMDTAPDCSGNGVMPIIHHQYSGGDIVLPSNPEQPIRVDEHPLLQTQIGNDIITADGTTLLGADDKAGIAEIMDAMNYLLKHPEIKHGKIRVLLTPDEEIGRGVDKINLSLLGADYAYTLDGETAGWIENETFSADSATLSIHGRATHPGFAKGQMEHAIRIASAIITQLPSNKAPETTDGKQPFIHPVSFQGGLESAQVKFIIRAFNTDTLKELENELQALVNDVLKKYPRSTAKLEFSEQYRNMKEVLDKHPQVVDYAIEAIGRTGLTPVCGSIRGGTDGSRLSFMGLPCPNLFAGGHGFHSKHEWISIQDMQKAVETIVHLCTVWEEKA